MNKIMLRFATILCFVVFSEACVKAQIKLEPQKVNAHLAKVGESPILKGPSVLNNEGYFVWGGSVVKGEDGRYHMFYSRWPSGENNDRFGDGWLINSEIAYAVSDYPDHDFKFVKVVLQGRHHEGMPDAWDGQSVHNPHIQKFEGKYYLYHTGSKYPGAQEPDTPGASLSKRNLIQQSQQLGVVTFDSIEDLVAGNIVRSDKPLLSPRTRVKDKDVLNPSPKGTEALPDNLIVVNPAVVQRPSDGKYLLFFKGNLYAPSWRGVHGVAIGDSPDGPFIPQDKFVFDVRDEDGKLASAEDPYVWYHDGSKRFYTVFKDFTGKITGEDPGLAIMYSEDGMDWKKMDNAMFMPLKIQLENGEEVVVNRLERPQFLIGEDGLPKVLYAACSIDPLNDKKDGSSFNIQIPLISSY
ncbi:glycoside hydrolase family protein [Echinicola sp. 20G]|uniref:glycoside hydrolase family protein n=1 Tax=Echinicola sp. 20G TaxID=2781961 RepID=UPI001910F920|nr:glycoside hydrolase family protein [Echinicola sp. 20G]